MPHAPYDFFLNPCTERKIVRCTDDYGENEPLEQTSFHCRPLRWPNRHSTMAQVAKDAATTAGKEHIICNNNTTMGPTIRISP